jgi:peptidoglycan/xylan/chitin deacetylase (PgdA/CDA1 family)
VPDWSRSGLTRDHVLVLRLMLAPHMPSAAAAVGVPLSLAGSVPGVVLTFDDGPHPEGTPAVAEALTRSGARGMFFLVGEQVERRPALVGELVAAGHEVAVHGYRHRPQPRLRAADVREDLQRARSVIEDAAGRQVTWHRPPYGLYSPAGLAAVREAGLRPLLWSRWGKDWRKFTTPGRIARRVVDDVRAGDVILLHDADFYSAANSHRHTVEALGLILAQLRARQIGTVLPV